MARSSLPWPLLENIVEQFYRVRLRAPLVNPRWSWGAVRESDQSVFLRVWQDEKIKLNGRWYMRLTANAHFAAHPGTLGWQERRRHLELVKNGRPAYMVMREAVDPTADPRTIRDFNQDEVFVGGELVEHNGDRWLELRSREPIQVQG
jgi:hypothetical protein